MEWLVLLVLTPAIIAPIVLLFGFAGCYRFAANCTGDEDCPGGTRCVDGACVAVGEVGEVGEVGLPPSAPEDLEANAVDESEIVLSWTSSDLAVTGFQVQRIEEGAAGNFVTIANPTGQTFRDTGLEEGTTYLYQVRAVDGQETSEPSNQTSATTLPNAPSNLVATPLDVDQIDLSWTNESATATRFSLERRLSGAATFTEIFNGDETSFSDTPPPGGSEHEYRVIAIIPIGFQNGEPSEVRSAPSATVSARTWALAFSALLTDPQDLQGFCLIQRISAAQLGSFPTRLDDIGTTVRLTVRSSGDLTIDRIYLSQVAPPPGDPWDSSAADITKVVDVSQGDPPARLLGSTSLVLGPIDYALDRTRDLLVAFDIGATAGPANVVSVAQSGATHYFKAATQESSVPDRASDFSTGLDRHYLVERIEVL
jgi:Fibronectin type III domain